MADPTFSTFEHVTSKPCEDTCHGVALRPLLFGNKKPQIIAGSFFALGGAMMAVLRGNAGTLGLFSVVMLLWPLLSSTGVTPQVSLPNPAAQPRTVNHKP